MTNPLPPAAQAALDYSTRGWRPIRLYGLAEDGKCQCKDRDKPGHENHAGKHPTDAGWQNAAAMTEAEIQQAWSGSMRERSNVGIATGAASGFFVIDVDPDNGGLDSMKRLQADHEALPATLAQRTGSGGYHLLFAMPEDFEPTNRYGGLKAYPGLDVRGSGGQIVAAPSISAKGAYEWLSEWTAEPEPAPAWLLELLRPKEPTTPAVVAPMPMPDDITDEEQRRLEKYAATIVASETARLQALHPQPSGRDSGGYRGEPWISTTFQVSCTLLEIANSTWTAYSREQAYADVFAAAPRDEGFTDEDVNKHFSGAVTKVGGQARPYPQPKVSAMDVMGDFLTTPGTPAPVVPGAPGTRGQPVRPQNDIGNAMRLVDHFGDRVRYLPDAGKWATYADGVWTLHSGTSEVQTLVQTMFTGLVQSTEALQHSENIDPNDSKGRTYREIFLAWVKAQGMDGRISGCLKQAQGRIELRAVMSDFDADPMLFNCQNGVVDLQTGALLPHDPSLLLMRQAAVDYDPAATAPLWDKFLERVQPDAEMREYLQRQLGYALTGSTREQCYFVWTGDGANGKSVAAATVQHVVGGYAGTVAPAVLLESREEQHPTGWASMAGKRLLTAQETAPGKRLDESKLKEFTGGQTVSARFMGRDFFDYMPVGKIFLISNHAPILSGDNSIWRRTHLLRWDVTIPERERDEELQNKLTAEASGILTWMVMGCLSWQKQKMVKPATALKHLAEWRGDTDSFGDFLDTCTLPSPGAKTPSSVLYESYQAWAFRQGLKPMSQPSFVQAMTERKFERYRSAGSRGFLHVVAVAPASTFAWGEEKVT